MLAIDLGANNSTQDQEAIASLVSKHFPQVGILKAKSLWGWGPGMYMQLCDSIAFARNRYSFGHFLSLDYDALFLRTGADAKLLADLGDEEVGLVASENGPSKHWAEIFKRKWPKVMEMTRGKQPDKNLWVPSSSVLGSCMLLSYNCMKMMTKRGYFDGQFRGVKNNLKISDDCWLRFLVALSGFKVANNRAYVYNVWQAVENYETVMRKNPNLYLWHPTKMRSGGRPADLALEKKCRDWFRARRGRKPI
jgi:hypothetical protein